jgi:sialidase-1
MSKKFTMQPANRAEHLHPKVCSTYRFSTLAGKPQNRFPPVMIIRPWIALLALSLCHQLLHASSTLTQSRTVIPLLTDAKPRPVLDLTLVLEEKQTITSLRFDLTADTGIFSSLALDAPGTWQKPDQENRTITFQGTHTYEAGTHRIRLLGALKTGTDLLARPQITCHGITFADGTNVLAQAATLPPLRPAYPIHQRGQFSCHTFRIPAIARAKDGSLLAVYDMRYLSARDLQGHMDIGLSRSTDAGQTWSDPTPIMDMREHGGKPQAENGCSDPNITIDPHTGEIFVSAVWTHGKPGTHQWTGKGSEPGHALHQSSQFLIVRSRDHGKTWSTPENWTTRLKDPAWHLFAPAPGNGIALRDGTLVMPTQGRDAKGLPFSNIMFSKDHGNTWTVSNHARTNTTECAVAELADGSLLLNMRDNRNRGDLSDQNGRALSLTTDLGQTWTTHPADHAALPEPVCMASMISHTLADGRHILLFSNPRDKSARKTLTLQLSLDGGKTWPGVHHILLDAPGAMYSSLVMIDAHTLGILYESSQADMVFQKIPLTEILPP